ncbi:hypothetical protein BRADI_1g54340v3 [Brachypodium distachyon]|uniref:Uncharacterized protein n=1 Tax=Brachypodium distachyon TaxID=15368 RepID=I1H2Q9_BRADI|nr:hypothetical protein BRADI_1g54340v3 [Brachypodium distachyon]
MRACGLAASSAEGQGYCACGEDDEAAAPAEGAWWPRQDWGAAPAERTKATISSTLAQEVRRIRNEHPDDRLRSPRTVKVTRLFGADFLK